MTSHWMTIQSRPSPQLLHTTSLLTGKGRGPTALATLRSAQQQPFVKSSKTTTSSTAANQIRLLGAISKPLSRQTLFASHSSPLAGPATFHPQAEESHLHDSPPTTHAKLLRWVQAQEALLEPDRVHWCDGSKEEYEEMVQGLVDRGVMIPLDSKLRPGSYLTRTDPADVARSESSTFICSRKEIDAG